VDKETEKLANGVKKGLKVIGKAFLLGAAITIGGAVLGGVVASAAGLSGLAVAGSVVLGLIGGAYGGTAAAGAYIASKAAPAVEAVGNFIDEANKELVAQGQQPVVIEGLTKKFDAAVTPATPAIEPLVATAPAPAAPKAPAQ